MQQNRNSSYCVSSEHEPATNPPRLAAIHRDPPHLAAIHQPRWQEEGTKKKRIEVRTRVRKARSNPDLEEARSSEMAAGPDLSGAGASGKKKGKGRREAPRVGLGFSSLSLPAVPSSCPRRALALRRSAGINAHQPASRMESRVWHFTGTEGVSWLGSAC